MAAWIISLAQGGMLGIFLYNLISDGSAIYSPWLFVPTAILLPFFAPFGDINSRLRGKTSLFLLISLLLIAAQLKFGNHALTIILFSIAFFASILTTTAIKEHSNENRALRSLSITTCGLFLFAGMYLILRPLWLEAVESILYPLIFGLSIISIPISFFLMDQDEEAEEQPQEEPSLGQAHSAFAQPLPEFHPAKSYIFYLMFPAIFIPSLYFLAYEFFAQDSQLSNPVILGVFILLAGLGSLLSSPFMLNFGIKRGLILCHLVLLLLIAGHGLAKTPLEYSLICMLMAVFVGCSLNLMFAFAVKILPKGHEHQALGYAYLMLIPAAFLSPYMGSIGTAILILVAIINLQSQKLLRPDNCQWAPDLATPLQGLSKHNRITQLMQLIARTLVEIFFGKIYIEGRENLPSKGGTIFVANHPNTFLDPLLVTAIVSGRLHYWAKATLWKLPLIGSTLDSMGAIPIYRRKDYEATGQTQNNNQSLSIAANKLKEQAQVLIFPEGVSENGLSLKPIKTGAARLGFLALNEMNWAQEITVVPIGLDYMEPSIFRSGVTIRIGTPIRLNEYQAACHQDERDAVISVTHEISEGLKNLLPHLNQPELEELVHMIHDLYGDQVLQILEKEDESQARLAIAEAVNHYQEMDPDTIYLFRQQIASYMDERERLSTPANHDKIPLSKILSILAGFFSITSYGLVTNWLPYRATAPAVELFTTAPVWKATAKLAIGGIIFSGYYSLCWLIIYLIAGPLIASTVVLSFLLTAFMALGSIDRFAFRLSQLKNLWQAFWTQDTNENMEAMKVRLIQDLERFRESYAFFKSQELK